MLARSSQILKLLFTLQFHGTYRRKDRIYREDTFGGRGKSLTEATGESYEKFVRLRSLAVVKYQSQSELIEAVLYVSQLEKSVKF